jgi:Rieske Fe-S protein
VSDGLGCPTSCPFAAPVGFSELLDTPVGYVRRIAATGGEVDETRRNLLKLAAVAGVLGVGAGGIVGGTLQFVQPPVIGIGSYPKTQLFDIDGTALTVDKVQAEYSAATSDLYLFNYPLRNEPNFLLNLYPQVTTPGIVPNAIGTYGSIIAYSAICQHLGCPAPAISYYPPGMCPNKTFSTKTFPSLNFYIHCSCHGSTYDVTNGASNLTGPAVLPLPQVVLVADPTTGEIYATGMTPGSPPVNGHLNTLQGDYGVGLSSQLAKEAPVILCTNFPS